MRPTTLQLHYLGARPGTLGCRQSGTVHPRAPRGSSPARKCAGTSSTAQNKYYYLHTYPSTYVRYGCSCIVCRYYVIRMGVLLHNTQYYILHRSWIWGREEADGRNPTAVSATILCHRRRHPSSSFLPRLDSGFAYSGTHAGHAEVFFILLFLAASSVQTECRT